MKILKSITVAAAVVLAIIFLCLNIFTLTVGKSLLSNRLSQAVGKNVKIGSLYIMPLYSVTLNNLKIEDFLTVDKITIEPSLSSLFLAKFGLNKFIMLNPKVSLIRLSDTKFNINEIIDRGKSQPSGGKIYFVKEAIVHNAQIYCKDTVTGVSFDIAPINASAITSLLDFKTRLKLDAKAVSQDKQNLGTIKGNGWLNFMKKDMDAQFSLEDADLVYFSVFFKKFLRKIKSGELQFSADMVSRSNDLTVDCHIETRNLRFGDDEALIFSVKDKEITAFDNLSGIVLNTLIGPGSGGIFDFSIHTKFDHPKLEGLKFKGNIFKESIKNIIQELPKEITKETVENIKDDFKAIGKELKEQFKDIFKIKKEENQETASQEGTPNQQ